MRDAFVRALEALAAEDERVFLLTGDLGAGLFDGVEAAAPGRVLNVGVAEQNLVGVAAGLSYAGKRPFAYSIAPFVTSRPNDQIRVDVAIAEAPVVLVGVGGGVAYGYLGPTHHAIEDVALMRALPGMTVVAPADPVEAAEATRALHALDGPAYLRLGKNGEPRLAELPPFALGEAHVLHEGADIALVATGPILGEALAARALLAARGIAASVVHVPTIQPLDAETIMAVARATGLVVVLEEHVAVGGLGGAVCEAICDAGVGARVVRLGLPGFAHAIGSRDHLLRTYGLDAEGVARRALEALDLVAA